MKYGSPAPCHASSFVKELPAEWIEHCDGSEILNAPVPQSSAKGRFDQLRALLEKVPG
jgi:hypothetical protein